MLSNTTTLTPLSISLLHEFLSQARKYFQVIISDYAQSLHGAIKRVCLDTHGASGFTLNWTVPALAKQEKPNQCVVDFTMEAVCFLLFFPF